jgi:ribonuclease T2
MKLKVLPLLALALLAALTACKSTPYTNTATYTTQGAAGDPQRGGSHPNPRLAAATGSFDFYLLNLSWSPEFCHSHPDAAECARRSTFVLHGLWPQNNDGSYPEHCAAAPGPAGQGLSSPGNFSDIYPEPGLLEHEWKQHGSCTGLSADDFFTAARTAWQSVKIPSELANLSSQTSMPPDQIAALFTQSNPSIPSQAIAISCGNNYLTAVEVCLDKSLHPIACSQVRSCRANTVRIAPPQ